MALSPAGRGSRSGCHGVHSHTVPKPPTPPHTAASAHLKSGSPSLPRGESTFLLAPHHLTPHPAHFWAGQVYTALLLGPYTPVSAQEAGCPPVPSDPALQTPTQAPPLAQPVLVWLGQDGQPRPESACLSLLGPDPGKDGSCWAAWAPAAASSRNPHQGKEQRVSGFQPATKDLFSKTNIRHVVPQRIFEPC